MSNQDQSRKTEKPTPKRIKDFRKKGDIAVSRDLAQASAMLGGAVGLALFLTAGSSSLAGLMQGSMMAADGVARAGLLGASVNVFLACVVPVSVGALIGYLVAAGAQLGWPPAFKMPKFDIGKVFTMSQIGQLISPKQAAGRVAKATAKVLFVGLAIVIALKFEFQALLQKPDLEPAALAQRSAIGVARLAAFALTALGALAVLDYFLARRRMSKKMMMTVEEVKRGQFRQA